MRANFLALHADGVADRLARQPVPAVVEFLMATLSLLVPSVLLRTALPEFRITNRS